MKTLIGKVNLLVKDFTLRDHIRIFDSSNDFNINETPLPKMILNKQKVCVQTIIMILFLPQTKPSTDVRAGINSPFSFSDSKLNIVIQKFNQ